jgi:hypothetical protein
MATALLSRVLLQMILTVSIKIRGDDVRAGSILWRTVRSHGVLTVAQRFQALGFMIHDEVMCR